MIFIISQILISLIHVIALLLRGDTDKQQVTDASVVMILSRAMF